MAPNPATAVPNQLALPVFAKTVSGIPMPVPSPLLSLGLIMSFVPKLTTVTPVYPSVNIYPRGGNDSSNYFTDQCPVCGNVHHIYSAGGYICYGLGFPGSPVLCAVSTLDFSSSAWAAALQNGDFVIES